MKTFQTDTKDCIEQLYKKRILRNFPNYAIFWNKFIGNHDRFPLKPYGLAIPKTLAGQKRKITDIYLEFGYAHYTLFCQLAGAHFQLSVLFRCLRYKNPWRKHFNHWEAFEVFYLHLGNVLYQFYHLWGLLFFYKDVIKRNKKGELRGTEPKLVDLLKQRRMTYLLKDIHRIDKNIKVFRDNITHYARVMHLPLQDGGYSVPIRLKGNHPWSSQARVKSLRDTRKKCERDLADVEHLLNTFHSLLIIELELYFSTNGIRIKN